MTTHDRIRLMVHGARGRMGARIVALVHHDQRFDLVAQCDLDTRAQIDALPPNTVSAIIDFSSDAGTQQAIALAQRHHAALLVGTTGLSPKTLEIAAHLAATAPVMIAPNTSRGVAAMGQLIALAARLLGPAYNIDLIEAHHTMKRDAPSGTALRLKQALREHAGVELPDQRIHCIRAGEIIGEHTVQFSGPGENLKISHAAINRDLFARGALDAMAWLHAQPPGMYTIEQSLMQR